MTERERTDVGQVGTKGRKIQDAGRSRERRRCLVTMAWSGSATGCLKICTVSRRYGVWLGARARPATAGEATTLQQQRQRERQSKIGDRVREREIGGESGGGSGGRATCCVVSDATRAGSEYLLLRCRVYVGVVGEGGW